MVGGAVRAVAEAEAAVVLEQRVEQMAVAQAGLAKAGAGSAAATASSKEEEAVVVCAEVEVVGHEDIHLAMKRGARA